MAYNYIHCRPIVISDLKKVSFSLKLNWRMVCRNKILKDLKRSFFYLKYCDIPWTKIVFIPFHLKLVIPRSLKLLGHTNWPDVYLLLCVNKQNI